MLLSATKCPYDEKDCEERIKFLEMWKEAIEGLARRREAHEFMDDAVARCPRVTPETWGYRKQLVVFLPDFPCFL